MGQARRQQRAPCARRMARLSELLALVVPFIAAAQHQPTPPGTQSTISSTHNNAIPGADPTGQRDSSTALNAWLRALCGKEPKGSRVAPTERVLDLSDGLYLLDAPLLIDSTVNCTGPLRVRGGTLLAGPQLGDDRFLVEAVHRNFDRVVGMPLAFENVVFASNYTGGGLLVNESSFTTVADCNFINFATFGIWTSGADFRLDRSVLIECTSGMSECAGPQLKATAMYIAGADSHFNRNVVACTHVGFVNADGDNFYHQNHIWTNCRPPHVDNGEGDHNLDGFIVSGGTPQIDGGAMDNCHLRFTSYRGAIVTNMHFNAVSKLILDPWLPEPSQIHPAMPPPTPRPPNPADTRCQYWTGSMCGLRVRNNRFGCGGSEPSNHGPKASCGSIWSNYTPPAAQQIDIGGNAWDNVSSAVCSLKEHCDSAAGSSCDDLIGLCADTPDSRGYSVVSEGELGGAESAAEWRRRAEQLCEERGFTLSTLRHLRIEEQVAALVDAGLSPLQRLRVLAQLEA